MPDSASVVLGPKLGEVVYADIGANFPNSLRALLRAVDALVQASVLSLVIATPPGSPSNGDAYVVAASPTGAWAGQAGNIAVWSTQVATADTNTKVPAWEFHAPKAGWMVFNAADKSFYVYDGTAWNFPQARSASSTLVALDGQTDFCLLFEGVANGGNQFKVYGSQAASGLLIVTGNTAFQVDVGTQLVDALLFGSGDSRAGGNTYISLSRTAAISGSGQIDAFNSGVSGTDLLLNSRFGGKVGVGNLTPAFDLDVTGDIAASATVRPGKFTVAGLPVGAEGQIAYATNGRKVGEGAGAGTGVPVYFSNAAWRTYSGDAAVTS